MYTIGIDPGKTGAMAYMKDQQLMDVIPFDGDISNCRTATITYCNFKPVYFIEQVTASPHMGVVSAFTFGRWAEAVDTAAILSGCIVHKVRPQVWQNAIGVFSAGDKDKLYARAKRLFPKEYERKLFNKSSSDAVMIAYYGWRYQVNKETEK